MFIQAQFPYLLMNFFRTLHSFFMNQPSGYKSFAIYFISFYNESSFIIERRFFHGIQRS